MCATGLDSWDVQRRNDGAVLVRVHSCDRQGRQLPDAVFAFRQGDPQYDYWETQLRLRISAPVDNGGTSILAYPAPAETAAPAII